MVIVNSFTNCNCSSDDSSILVSIYDGKLYDYILFFLDFAGRVQCTVIIAVTEANHYQPLQYCHLLPKVSCHGAQQRSISPSPLPHWSGQVQPAHPLLPHLQDKDRWRGRAAVGQTTQKELVQPHVHAYATNQPRSLSMPWMNCAISLFIDRIGEYLYIFGGN